MLAAVVADPGDDTVKLAYADWLEERDDPRGPFLREQLAAVRASKPIPIRKFAPDSWLDLVGLSLLRKIHDSEFSKHERKLMPLARPALRITSKRFPFRRLPIGTSQFGGRPDAPGNFDWPMRGDEPLAFLAQFNLKDLSASVACRELPASGLLSFFSVYDDMDWGKLGREGAARVYYFPDTSKLTRHAPPYIEFNPCRLSFTETITMPDSDSPWKKELGLGEEQIAYSESISGYGQGHMLLGHPAPTRGDPLGKKTERHLLTLRSDKNTDWKWGQNGVLYFTIDEADLKKHRFDRVKLKPQWPW